MKRFFRAFCDLFLTAAVLGCMVLLFLISRAPVFERGESYVYSLGASSSARMVQTDDPVLWKLLLGDVKGESAVYRGDRYEAIKAKFRAKLLFSETVCGVTSYYLVSPLLGGGVELNGTNVNLQIAVSEGQTVAGTPLIFAGF